MNDFAASLPPTVAKRLILSLSLDLIDKPYWELQSPVNKFTLSSILEILDMYDENRIVTVRKIHRLGLDAPQILRENFPTASQIFILPSKGSNSPRPASMGFIVFPSRTDTQTAIGNHEINGATILVQRFTKSQPVE